MRVSEYFNLGSTQPYLDFVDIRLDTDIPVFVDPSSIKSLNSNWGHELASLLQSFFETVLTHIKSGNHQKAQKLLSSLNERNEFHLGYSKGKSRGHAFGKISAESVWGALSKSQASLTGLLQDIEDSCLLLEGIGTDMISDAVCNIIRGPLIKYTQEMCEYHNIPMQENVESGPIWNSINGTWGNTFVSLPITTYGKVLLVPKILVRQKISYQFDEYYRYFLLPQMQHDEIQAGSSLVQVLKDGRERVTKKSLMKKYGKDKLSAAIQTSTRTHVLQDYKNYKKSKTTPPLSHEDLAEIESSPAPDWASLFSELKNITTGNENATKYESAIEKLLTSLLYPSLCHPTRQQKIHDGRKRIDITYLNEAKIGFFHWLSLHYPCSQIHIECKNYTKDIANPELDQLSGRFSPNRGKIGIMLCRNIQEKELFLQRCKDTASDDRGFIIPLDDNDLEQIINEKLQNPDSQEFDLLKRIFLRLINNN